MSKKKATPDPVLDDGAEPSDELALPPEREAPASNAGKPNLTVEAFRDRFMGEFTAAGKSKAEAEKLTEARLAEVFPDVYPY